MNNYTQIEYVTNGGQFKIAYAECKSSDLKFVYAKSTKSKRKTDLIIHFDFVVSSIDLIKEIETVYENENSYTLTEEERGYFGI